MTTLVQHSVKKLGLTLQMVKNTFLGKIFQSKEFELPATLLPNPPMKLAFFFIFKKSIWNWLVLIKSSPECYTTFWMITIYSDILHW